MTRCMYVWCVWLWFWMVVDVRLSLSLSLLELASGFCVRALVLCSSHTCTRIHHKHSQARTGTLLFQTLDMSFNAVGSTLAVEALARFFRDNEVCVHLDLSHNAIGKHSFPELREASNLNYNIRGLHMSGTQHTMHVRQRQSSVGLCYLLLLLLLLLFLFLLSCLFGAHASV